MAFHPARSEEGSGIWKATELGEKKCVERGEFAGLGLCPVRDFWHLRVPLAQSQSVASPFSALSIVR